MEMVARAVTQEVPLPTVVDLDLPGMATEVVEPEPLDKMRVPRLRVTVGMAFQVT